MSNKDIAEKFDVNVNTVQYYRRRIASPNYASTMPKRTRLKTSDSLEKSEPGNSYCDLEKGTSEEQDQFFITGTYKKASF